MSEFLKAALADEIPAGHVKLVELNGKEIAIFNVDGSFHAIDNMCSHVGGPLSEGMLSGCEVTCPWHGAVFDVTTGEALGPPAGSSVTRYNLKIDGANIEIEV